MRQAMPISRIRALVAGVSLVLIVLHPTATAAQARPPADIPEEVADYKWEPRGLIAEPDFIERAVIFADRHFGSGGISNGFYLDSGELMVPGAGWISVGPGYRRWSRQDRIFVDTSAAISWRGYRTAHARVELPRLARSRITLGSQVLWQDAGQLTFFGEGPVSLASNVSEYRLRSTDLVGYATLRPGRRVAIDVRLGWLKPSILQPAGFFARGRPNAADLFPDNIVYALAAQPSFRHAEIAARVDTRDYPGHPTRGGVLRAAVARYSDRDRGVFSFRRYEAEAARFVPLAGSRLVLAFHGWLVTSDTVEGQVVPFYLQPSLGGRNSLRSYPDYRFRDRHLLLVNAEARVAVMTHVDAAVFVDAGNVTARVGDLGLAKRSYGAGLRLHSRRQTFARLDVSHGGEGWHALFRLTDPLTLSRIGRRAAAAPFVP
jgi:hypothetical protein